MTTSSKEFVITLGARPGTLATFLRAVAKENINLRGGSGYNVGDYDMFRVVTDDPARTEAILDREGIAHRTNDVLIADVPDRPGGFLSVVDRLASSGLNIHAVYNLASTVPGTAVVAFGFAPQDVPSARKVLGA